MPSADERRRGEAAVKAESKGNLSKQDQEDLSAIDASLDRMRSFTPSDPYILTIPQDVEPRYHHSYAFQARQWLDHTPFDYREHESTQYQTFVFHEPGKDMYMLHNSWPQEGEEGEASSNGLKARERAGTMTGANTPNAAPKKTMSLGAYKKKQTGATPEPESAKEVDAPVKKAAVKGPVERVKADEEVLAAVADGEDVLAPSQAEDKKGLKRKRDDSTSQKEVTKIEQKSHEKLANEKQPVPKQPPRSPSPTELQQPKRDEVPASQKLEKPSKSSSQPSTLTRQPSLPPKLSPPPPTSNDTGMPPRLSPPKVTEAEDILLPSRLSPTIPANITETLKARAHFRSTSRSSDVSVSVERNLTPPRSTEASVAKRISPVPRNGFRANSSSPAVRSDVEESRGRPLTSVPPRTSTPQLESDGPDETAVSTAKKSPEKPQSLLVRLKFKKSQREVVRRILKMRPNAAKSSTPQPQPKAAEDVKPVSKTSDQRHRERRDTNAKGVAQKIGPVSVTTAAVKKEKPAKVLSPELKRPRSEDAETADEPPAKRKRALTQLDATEAKKKEPSTPVQPEQLSPSNVQKSATQPTPSTVRKDLLSVAMKREQSADSNQVNTPSALSQNSPTANGTLTSQPPNGTLRPASSQPSNKTPKQQAWETEQRRLEMLGRELKHAASAHLKTLSMPHADPTAPLNEQKLAAIKSVESLLAYILAFICSDEAAIAADPKMNPPIKNWRTLHGFFGFVKRNCEAFPLLLGVACLLGVVFNAHILDLATQHPAEMPSRDSILETQAMMQRAASDAEAKLDVDILLSTFPRSWEGRSKGSLEVDKLEPGKGFEGRYKLPTGLQTCPLRAARAGYAMLKEWISAQDGLGYGLMLKL